MVVEEEEEGRRERRKHKSGRCRFPLKKRCRRIHRNGLYECFSLFSVLVY